MDFLTLLAQDHSIGGGIGSVISLRFSKVAGIAAAASTVLSGWAAAFFLTKPIVRWLKLVPPDEFFAGVGFLIGLFSMLIVAAIWMAIIETRWGSAIEQRISGRPMPAPAPSFGEDK